MRTKYLLLLLALWQGLSYAQPRFVPDMEIAKVGEVAFQQPRRVSFGFANKGNKALVLESVHPSCGCVDVSFTKSPIEPGARGEIMMTYDAKMLGTFHKELEIWTNESSEPVYLAMEGSVVSDLTDFSGDFPIDLGNVRLQTNYVEFDDVNKGDRPVVELSFVNTERSVYHPELMHLPSYLVPQYIPENVAPGKVGKIRLSLDSEKLHQMGLNQTSIYLARYLGDKVSDTNEIIVSAVLLPDFSSLSDADRAMAPELYIPEPTVEFGSMGTKDKLTKTVYLLNMGKSDLHIKQVQVFNKAVTVNVGNQVLKPGKSTKVKISVLAKYLKNAKSYPRVLLITDDPNHAKEVIKINVQP